MPQAPLWHGRLVICHAPTFSTAPHTSVRIPVPACSDPAKYLSALLLSLGTMLHLELPQVWRCTGGWPLACSCLALLPAGSVCLAVLHASRELYADHCGTCARTSPPPAPPRAQVNVLSKVDLVEQYGELAFSLDFYLQAQGLDHLADAMEGSLPPRFQRMTRELCEVGGLRARGEGRARGRRSRACQPEGFAGVVLATCRLPFLPVFRHKQRRWVRQPYLPRCPCTHAPPFPACVLLCRQVIEDFGLLSFHPLAVEDRDSMRPLAALIDKSNGFVFAGLAREGEAGDPRRSAAAKYHY